MYWTNKCEHGGYLFSFEYSTYHEVIKYDVYYFQNGDDKHFCIRYGNEGREYLNPGSIVDIVRHYREIPLYRKIYSWLQENGKFNWTPNKELPRFDGWVAIYDTEDDYGDRILWYFMPKDWWDTNGHVQDNENDSLEIDGFDNIMGGTWETTMSLEEAKEKVKSMGFELIEDPIWWYDR